MSRSQAPGRAAAATGGGAGHVDDRGQAVAVRNHTVPAAVGRPGRGWQQRLDDRPQPVRHQVVNENRHRVQACHTVVKGAKRRLRRMRSSVGRDSGGHPIHSGEWPGWFMRQSLVCPWLCGVRRLDFHHGTVKGLAGLELDRAEHPRALWRRWRLWKISRWSKMALASRQLEAPTVVAAAYGQVMAAAVAVIASFRDSWWVLEVALTQALSAHRKPGSCGASPGFGSARGAGRVWRRPRPLRQC